MQQEDAAAPRSLLDLTEDEQSIIGDALCNPLRPSVAVALCSACRSLRALMQRQLTELRAQHRDALALCVTRLLQSCADVHDSLRLNWRGKGLDAADAVTVGMLFRARALPTLQELHLDFNPLGDEGMGAMAAGITPGALRCLTTLVCNDNLLADGALGALAAAIGRGGLPALTTLHLSRNRIGDAGVRALAAGLCGVNDGVGGAGGGGGGGGAPFLDTLFLDTNDVGDEGVRALLAAASASSAASAAAAAAAAPGGPSWPDGPGGPGGGGGGGGVLSRLKNLSLSSNRVGGASLAALCSLDRRALPALELLWLDHNRLGDAGLARLAEALSGGGAGGGGAGGGGAGDAPGALQLLPSLEGVYLEGNPASDAAQQAIHRALAG